MWVFFLPTLPLFQEEIFNDIVDHLKRYPIIAKEESIRHPFEINYPSIY